MKSFHGHLVLVALAAFLGCTTDAPLTTAPLPTADVPPAANATTPPAHPRSSAEPVVIDVRSKAEWDSGHVERAVHIPHTEIAERIAEVTTDKEAQIVVYCAVGGRAAKAKAELEKLGYTNVENGGGYDDVKERF